MTKDTFAPMHKPRCYHIGLAVDWSKQKRGQPLRGRLTIQARRGVDYLDCELWRYSGQHMTTKRSLRAKAEEFMAWVNRRYGTEFSSVVVD